MPFACPLSPIPPPLTEPASSSVGPPGPEALPSVDLLRTIDATLDRIASHTHVPAVLSPGGLGCRQKGGVTHLLQCEPDWSHLVDSRT